ncbi:MAG TPA: hypothetical protein VFW19_04665 [Allosphingosinicella sp.]|nr:hypothetical protein [Allosphingosinicella sp.]
MGSGLARIAIAAALLIGCAGADSPEPPGPPQTDRIVVRDVADPVIGSGFFAVYARVRGMSLSTRAPRAYFILYGGEGQTLPAAGARCEISYRYRRLAEGRLPPYAPPTGLVAEHFACDDGRQWTDEWSGRS